MQNFENAQRLEINVKVKATGLVFREFVNVANCDNKWDIIEPILDGYTKKFGPIYWAIREVA